MPFLTNPNPTSVNIGKLTNITYTEAVALQTAATIVPGAMYRLTDFQTLHKIPGTSDRNDTNVTIPIEVLILTGKSTTEFETLVYSETYPDDIIYYTTDNTAWKDLQIAGQKGCITYRLDTLNNVRIGNGDWRVFKVRRWAYDYTAYNNKGIKWLLFDPAWNWMGCTTTGGYESMPAISTSVYNAATNPYGYKDLSILATGMVVVNIIIDARVDNTSTFEMPNMTHDGLDSNGQSGVLKNIHISGANNLGLTGNWYGVTLGLFSGSIFLEGMNYPQGLQCPDILSVFCNVTLKGSGEIGKIVECSLIDETVYVWGSKYPSNIVLKDIYNVRVVLETGTSQITPIRISNLRFCYLKVNRSTATQFYKFINFDKNQVGNTFTDVSAQTTNIFFDPTTESNLQTTSAAVAAMAMANNIDRISGIWNLTGSGTVNIDTFTRLQQNNFPVTLVPASGLVIKIPTNNVANGFIQNETIVANGTLGEKLILTPVGDRWMVSAGNVVGSFVAADYSATQLDKTDTTLTDIPNLISNLKAGQAYSFKAKLFVDADAVGGYKFGITGTAGINNLIWQVDAIDNTTNAFVINSRQTTFTSVGAVGAIALIINISGTIVVSTAGTLKLQFAQNVANGTSSVLVGSTFDVQQLIN